MLEYHGSRMNWWPATRFLAHHKPEYVLRHRLTSSPGLCAAGRPLRESQRERVEDGALPCAGGRLRLRHLNRAQDAQEIRFLIGADRDASINHIHERDVLARRVKGERKRQGGANRPQKIRLRAL